MTELRRQGFHRLRQMLEAFPTATYGELAKRLDTVPGFVTALAREEAELWGEIDIFVVESFVRRMREVMPEGWMVGVLEEKKRSFMPALLASAWVPDLPEDVRGPARAMLDCVRKRAVQGWQPAGPRDTLLLEAFGVAFGHPPRAKTGLA